MMQKRISSTRSRIFWTCLLRDQRDVWVWVSWKSISMMQRLMSSIMRLSTRSLGRSLKPVCIVVKTDCMSDLKVAALVVVVVVVVFVVVFVVVVELLVFFVWEVVVVLAELLLVVLEFLFVELAAVVLADVPFELFEIFILVVFTVLFPTAVAFALFVLFEAFPTDRFPTDPLPTLCATCELFPVLFVLFTDAPTKGAFFPILAFTGSWLIATLVTVAAQPDQIRVTTKHIVNV